MRARPTRVPHTPADDRPPLRRKSVRLPAVAGTPGLPVDADAPERRRTAAPLGQIVTRLLGHYHIRLSARPEALLAAWPEMAGTELAARLRPGKLEDGILYLYARTSADLFEIRRFKLRGLEARVRQHPACKDIRQVRLQLDPGDERTP